MSIWTVLKVVGSLVDVVDLWLSNNGYERPRQNGQALENSSLFREEVYELAFGSDAIRKGYTDKEVLNKLKMLTEKSSIMEK